jgi:catechol 2,3-dioxygenase-like lactoylglutathione lyase family enzyme
METAEVSVRYIVNDVKTSAAFYKEHLGFQVDIDPTSGFAALSKGNVKLFLNQPGAGGAGQKMPDGQSPEPGGWNRIQISVGDLSALYEDLKVKGVEFRNDIIEGVGGKQVLLKDPSGNLVELFQPGQNKK